ncbi:MAG: hypothetical protein K0Q87_75 [Neobacillus sp.]|jgi:hypothetical protein|nr:hypothetical protein [Neobacillus sp.]
MPFYRVKSLDGTSSPIEYYLLTNAEAAVFGEGLKMVSGRLTKAAPTDTPEFISLREQAAEATSKTPLPVVRVTEFDEYEVNTSPAIPATNVGAKVTLGADGASVTNTTASGVFAVSYTDGVARARGYFRR